MPDFTRRTALRWGGGAAGAAALGRLSRPVPAMADPAEPTMVTGTFVSAARGGVPTNWAIARPPGQTRPLRPVIALHGKGSSAAAVMAWRKPSRPGCRRSRWWPSTAGAATGTTGPPVRTPVRWCSMN